MADAVEEVAGSADDTFVAAAAVAGVEAVPDILAVGGMLAAVVNAAVAAAAGAVAHIHYQTTALPSVAAAASIAKDTACVNAISSDL